MDDSKPNSTTEYRYEDWDLEEEDEDVDFEDFPDGNFYPDFEKEFDLSLWPFIAAANAGDLIAVRKFLDMGADMNEATDRKRTAMWYAAWNGHLEVVRLLLERGAHKYKSSDRCRWSPMHAAVSKGHKNVVQILHATETGPMANIMQYNHINMRDGCCNTPLIIACCHGGHVEVARYLLEQGADVNMIGQFGMTPLHSAVECGQLEIAKLLMAYGADLNARDTNGQLPINVGYGSENEEMKQAILDEPRRRLDHGHKRATEQHSEATTSASAQQEEEVEALYEGEAVEGVVADEDQDSEPSSDEEDDK